MSGWVFLSVSIVCSILVAHVLRWSKEQKSIIPVVFLFNYSIAFLLSFLQADYQQFSLVELISGICIGSIYISSFYLFAESVKQNGLGVSVTSMRVSLAIPILGSIIFYNESLSFAVLIGLVFIFLSLYLSTKTPKSTKEKQIQTRIKTSFNKNRLWLALGLFIIAGIGDFSMKVYESSLKVQENPNAFLSFIFGTAALIALFQVLKNSLSISKQDAFLGIILGVPNVLSSLFMIFALEKMNAVVCYSIANIAVIIGSIGIGFVYWKDKLSNTQWTGIGLAVVSILILSSFS